MVKASFRIPAWAVLPLLFCPSLLGGAVPKTAAEEGVWSKRAFSVPRRRAFKVPSPDRKKTLLVQDTMLIVTEAGGPVPGID